MCLIDQRLFLIDTNKQIITAHGQFIHCKAGVRPASMTLTTYATPIFLPHYIGQSRRYLSLKNLPLFQTRTTLPI